MHAAYQKACWVQADVLVGLKEMAVELRFCHTKAKIAKALASKCQMPSLDSRYVPMPLRCSGLQVGVVFEDGPYETRGSR